MITASITYRFDRTNRLPQIALIAAVALLLQGCAERRPKAFPWATAIVVKPRVPTPATHSVAPPELDVPAPELPWDGKPPAPLVVSARGPARPRTLAPPPVESNTDSKPESLSLAPQLSGQEVAAAQQQVNDSIAAALRGLDQAKGRHLSPAQSDLATKVRAFIEESRGASHDGDWNRARNLAKKAQVLAEELAGSL